MAARRLTAHSPARADAIAREGQTIARVSAAPGGGIGWALDSASGADNKYDDTVNVTLVPKSPTVQRFRTKRRIV